MPAQTAPGGPIKLVAGLVGFVVWLKGTQVGRSFKENEIKESK